MQFTVTLNVCLRWRNLTGFTGGKATREEIHNFPLAYIGQIGLNVATLGELVLTLKLTVFLLLKLYLG